MEEHLPAISIDHSRFPFVEVSVAAQPSPDEILLITEAIITLCGSGKFALQWTLLRSCPRISENDRELYLKWFKNNRELIERNILAVGVVLARPSHRAAFIAFSWLADTGALFRGFLSQNEATEFLVNVLQTHNLPVPRDDSDERTPTPISM